MSYGRPGYAAQRASGGATLTTEAITVVVHVPGSVVPTYEPLTTVAMEAIVANDNSILEAVISTVTTAPQDITVVIPGQVITIP